MENIVRLRHTGKARGEIELATLGFFLQDKQYSPKPFDRNALTHNPEIMHYETLGMVELVSEIDYRKYLAEQAEIDRIAGAAEDIDPVVLRTSSNIEDSLSADRRESARKVLGQVKESLAALEKVIFDTPRKAPQETGVSEVRQRLTDSMRAAEDKKLAANDDGLDLPWSAPKGLLPQAPTAKYLTLPDQNRKAYIKGSRDITLLRDIAMHEPLMALKKLARKQVSRSEKTAADVKSIETATAHIGE